MIDRVDLVAPPPRQTLRDRFFEDLTRLTLGLVQVRGGGQYVGPLELIHLGEPHWEPEPRGGGRWVHPVDGGLLVRRPVGTISVGWEFGELIVEVEDFEPALPPLIYDFTQRPFHRFIARLSLLGMRGRMPPPGNPSDPLTRLAGGAIDVAICAVLARLFRRRIGEVLEIESRRRHAGAALPGLSPALARGKLRGETGAIQRRSPIGACCASRPPRAFLP